MIQYQVMTWLYLSLASVLNFTYLNLLSRVVSRKSRNPRVMSVIFNFIAILMTLIIFIFSSSYKNFSLPKGFSPYFYLFLACLFYGLNERLRFYVSKYLEASLFAIVSNISIVVAFIIALFLYNESITTNKMLGFLLIMSSLLLVSFERIKKISWRGIGLALLTSTFVGVAWSLDKKGIYYFNLETYNVFVWLLPFLIVYFPGVKFSDIKREIKINKWSLILLSFLNVFGYFLNLKAQSLAEVTKVIPIIQTSTVLTVIFGIFILKEKSHWFKKILAGMIAVVGVFLLR